MTRTNVAGWHEVGGHRFYSRSKSELRYSLYLQWLKNQGAIVDWQYEPKTFWFNDAGANLKRGCVSYKPDFLVVEKNAHHWVEVKGYMDAKSKTKIARFKKYFPQEKLEVVTASWFTRNSKKLKGLVPGWI